MTNKIYSPLLTIAIPSWNRAAFLRQNLAQLMPQLAGVEHLVEVLISDNCSTDESPDVVNSFIQKQMPIRYIRNATNVGSDHNIAQCFNEASGRYVLILGDDDLLVDGLLPWLVERLAQNDFGVLCMKSYGFDDDFRKEYPGGGGEESRFIDGGKFLVEIGSLVTFISACVINKQLLGNIDARQFCGGNLVQAHLVIRAALLAKESLFVNRYLIACKRNNSGGYEFSRVFVEELGNILNQYQSMGLAPSIKQAFENRMLVGYYPFYLFRQRFRHGSIDDNTQLRFQTSFGDRWIFRILLKPILRLPRPLAVIWGAAATILGRTALGDLRRGIMFAWHRVARKWRK